MCLFNDNINIYICTSIKKVTIELNKPKMAYSRDALLETRERQDQSETRETREKLERYGAMEDGLS